MNENSIYELSRLERNRYGAGNRGASELGAILGGGGARQAQLFNQGASQGATMASVLAQARMRQQQALGREALATALEKKGDLEGANVIRAATQFTPQGYSQSQLYDQKRQNIADLMKQAGGATDPNILNRELAVLQGKPMTLSDVKGNVEFNPSATPDSQKFNPTDLGQAIIGAQHALAGEHEAQAARAVAGIGADKAANYDVVDTPQGKVRINKLTGDVAPLSLNGKPVMGKAGATKAATVPASELTAILAGEDGKVDPTKAANLLAVQNRTPGIGLPQALNTAGLNPSEKLPGTLQPDQQTQSIMDTLTQGGTAPAPGSPAHTAAVASKLTSLGAPPQVAAQAAQQAAGASTGRKVVRTGVAPDGTRVVQYEDGTIAPAGQ